MIRNFQKYIDNVLEEKMVEARAFVADGRCVDFEDYKARCATAKAIKECREILNSSVSAFLNEVDEDNDE